MPKLIVHCRDGLHLVTNPIKTDATYEIANDGSKTVYVKAQDQFEYDRFVYTGTSGTATLNHISNDRKSLDILVKNIKADQVLNVYGKLRKAWFHVTEPLDIIINSKITRLLQTIQPSYGKSGAVNGLNTREPYELEVNDAVMNLIEQGILIETTAPETETGES